MDIRAHSTHLLRRLWHVIGRRVKYLTHALRRISRVFDASENSQLHWVKPHRHRRTTKLRNQLLLKHPGALRSARLLSLCDRHQLLGAHLRTAQGRVLASRVDLEKRQEKRGIS